MIAVSMSANGISLMCLPVSILIHKIIVMILLQVLIQYCGVCLFYADETFLTSNSEQPILTLPSFQPVRWVMFSFSFNCKKLLFNAICFFAL